MNPVTSGTHPGPPVRPTDDDLNAILLQSSRSERRAVAWTIGFLSIVTVYFAALNAYILVKAAPRQYRLQFEKPVDAIGHYAVGVRWTSGGPAAPRVLIDGVTVPEANEHGRPNVVVSLNRASFLNVRVGASTSAGNHEGELLFRRIDGPAELPSVLRTPILVNVSAGVWNNWFVLRYWLIVVIVCLLLLYAFCYWYFPAPEGKLLISAFDRSSSTPVDLRMSRIAWFLPWKRSTLPLKHLLLNAGVPRHLAVNGEIAFVETHMVPQLSVFTSRIAMRVGSIGTGHRVERATLRQFSGFSVMYSNIAFVIGSDREPKPIYFTYMKV